MNIHHDEVVPPPTMGFVPAEDLSITIVVRLTHGHSLARLERERRPGQVQCRVIQAFGRHWDIDKAKVLFDTRSVWEHHK